MIEIKDWIRSASNVLRHRTETHRFTVYPDPISGQWSWTTVDRRTQRIIAAGVEHTQIEAMEAALRVVEENEDPT